MSLDRDTLNRARRASKNGKHVPGADEPAPPEPEPEEPQSEYDDRIPFDGFAGRGEPLNSGEFWDSPRPIPDSLPAVLPFDYAMLPNAFAPFAKDISERMQCPPDFPGVATMVALASVVGRQIGICPKRHDDWLVVPNLWGGVIGRPGIMKTPAIREAMRFPSRLEIVAKETHEKAVQDFENELAIYKVRKAQKEAAIKEAIRKKKDPLEAAKAFDDAKEPKEPTCRRYVVNDITVECLGAVLNKNPNGVMMFRDELSGWLANLDREGQESARAFYLEAWDGMGTFNFDRIGRGHLFIESVTVSILGGIQPGRLFEYLRHAIRGGVGDDGLVQRFQLLVYPDVTKEWVNVDRWPDTIEKQRAWAVFEKMATVDTIALDAKRDDRDIPFLRFDPEAQDLFDAWRASLEKKIRSGDEHPAIESHLAKYRSLVPRMALLSYLADGRTGAIGAESIKKALAWVRYLESHARRIYSIVTNPAAASAKELARRIQKGQVKDGFTARSIYNCGWAALDKQGTEAAIDMLLELGWLKEVTEATGGKPKTRYRINPRVFA